MHQSLKLCRKQKVELQTVLRLISAIINYPWVYFYWDTYFLIWLLVTVLISSCRIPFTCRARLVITNSLSFCLPGNVLISIYFWQTVWPNIGSFSFRPLKILSPGLKVSDEESYCMWWVTSLLLHSRLTVFISWTVWLSVLLWVSFVYPAWGLLSFLITFTSLIKLGTYSGIISSIISMALSLFSSGSFHYVHVGSSNSDPQIP